jgi:acyl dehydratase
MYFEDLVVGERETTPAMTITEAHVALYRGLTGDDVAPPGTVPDLLPLCLCTGLGWRVNRPPLAVLAFMSIDWQIARPLRVGDTVHCRLQTAAKRSLRDAGVIIETQEVRDHRGDLVQSGRFTFMIAKRPAPSP